MMSFFVAALFAGTFALQTGNAKTSGHVRATQVGSSPLNERLDLWLTDAHAKTITRYKIDMTKYVHLIVISDDFRSFAHVHPTLGPDGRFHIDHRFPHPGLYHVYADAEPESFGQQVFRYDLPIGNAPPEARTLAQSQTSVDVDGYHVTIGSTSLRVGEEAHLPVHITKNGRPATDLHPYLGALAHAVFIDGSDLSYSHVHPMSLHGDGMSGMSGMSGDSADMPGMDMAPLPDTAKSDPDMLVHVRVTRPGLYKLWLQFRGGARLHVASFVLKA